MTAMESFIAAELYRFHYYAQGRSPYPPLVFLHGFLGDGRDFQDIMTALESQFYCLAIDLPGHGQTRIQDDHLEHSMVEIASGVIQCLDALNIPKCTLVGYSLGGRLALYLALHFPDYFSRVVLESASPGLKTAAERRQRLHHDWVLAHALETEEFSDFLDRWYRQPLFTTICSHPAFEQLWARRLCNDPLQLAASLRCLSTGRQPSLWERLSANQVPMLLLAGERDQKFVDINREMVNLGNCMAVKIVEDCGHNIHFEQPTRYAQILQIWGQQA